VRALKHAWRWLDDLTGLSETVGATLTHPVPRDARWYYVFGSGLLVIFIVQVVTGVALSTAYVTSSGQAFDSLRAISSAPLGRMVRGIHSFGASVMIVLVGVHAIQVYLAGAYKFPRQMNWLTGVGLLLFTLGMAFTGQLLRWDQTGFWTSVIAAEQAGRTPVIGEWLGHFLLGGNTAGGATLSRFFAAHVFLIPALIFPFIGVHLYLVLHHGISEPPRAGRPVDPRTYRQWYRDLLAREGVPFWPDAAWRDVVFAALVVLTTITLALVYGPPALETPPDPTIIEASPRPDWYFLWYFAVLTVIPTWTESYVIILGPLFFGATLVLLPFAASRGERSPWRRPWAIGVVLAIVFVIGYYGWMGKVAPWSPRFDTRPLPAEVVGTTSGPVAEGATLYHRKGCAFCHLVAGEGGLRGPDLTDVGRRLSRAQMETRLLVGGDNMPAYRETLSAAERARILDFLESRKASPAPKP
jgi:ubiquinol-cytochrome c reductase cytochrome b subunit